MRLHIELRQGYFTAELYNSLYKFRKYAEEVATQNTKALKAQRIDCQHCNGTGTVSRDDRFDLLCPHCTPPHCVMCGNKVAPVEAGNYRYCRPCARQEEGEL